MKLKVLLLRHAQTPGNLELRYIGGRTDQPLSGEGERAARAVTGLPAAARVYVSPMIRAKSTAEILFPHAEQIPLEGLREMDFGAFEGKNAAELKDDACYTEWVNGGCEGGCPGGESMAVFSERVCAAFESAVRRAVQNGDERLVVVAHGGTVMAVMARYARPPRRYHEWRVQNCGGWRAVLDTEKTPYSLTDCRII